MPMSSRQWIGLALMAAGAVLAVIGVIGLVNPGGPAPVASASPSASAQASSEPASPTPAPTPTVPPLGEADVRAFVEVLVTAIQIGDVDTLVANLHPATIERYGQDPCRTAVAGFTNPDFDIEVLEVQDQASWDYVTDDLTTSIPDAWTVPGNLTVSAGQPSMPLTFHFAPFGDAVRWFTDCTPS